MCEQLRRTAQELGAGEGIEVVQADALAWLAGPGERYDVAFVDPPYASGLAGQALAALEPQAERGRARVRGGAVGAGGAVAALDASCARAPRAP